MELNPSQLDPHSFLSYFALGYIGVTELTGHNDGPFVEMFQGAVDGVAQGEPWCMCFVQFCVQQVGQQYGLQSPLAASEHVLTTWNNSQALRVEQAFPGAVVCWQREGTTNGHAGIVTGVQNGNFTTVEGNTSGGAGLNRDGEGVYEKIRSFSGEPGFILLGFLDPFKGVADV